MSLYSIVKLAKQFQKFAGLNKVEFNTLRTLSERKKYLKDHNYIEIDEGSSRIVYALSSKKALKLATNKAGIAQNRSEYKTLTEFQSKYLPKFYDKAPDDSWIEVELCKPLNQSANKHMSYALKEEMFNDPDFLSLEKKLLQGGHQLSDTISNLNLGINSSGHLILLDLGCTEKIYKNYYTGNEYKESFENPKYKYTEPDSTMKRIIPVKNWISKDPKNR